MATTSATGTRTHRTRSQKPIHVARIKNLKALIKHRFDDNATDCARAIKRTHTFIWQLVNGYRSIGEGTARHIEAMLGLQPNSLDTGTATERSDALIAHLGQGRSREYRLCPQLDLDALDAKPIDWHVAPVPGTGEGSFCVAAPASGKRGIVRGDLAFCDPKNLELCPECLFVVKVPLWEGAAGLLVAHKLTGKRWTFGTATAPTSTMELYQQKDVTIVARVVAIVRHL